MQPQHVQQPMLVMPVPTHNGLAVAGFLIAFVGLFIPTGIVALLGLILSVAALGRAPRFFAILGVLFGLLGVLLWGAATLLVLGILAVVAVVLAVFAVIAMVVAETELTAVTADMFNIQVAAIEAMDRLEENDLPALDALGLSESTLTDPWGRAYRLEAGKDGVIEVISDGPDGIAGTEDDLRTSGLPLAWERALEALPGRIRTVAHRIEKVEQHRSSGTRPRGRLTDAVILLDDCGRPER